MSETSYRSHSGYYPSRTSVREQRGSGDTGRHTSHTFHTGHHDHHTGHGARPAGQPGPGARRHRHPRPKHDPLGSLAHNVGRVVRKILGLALLGGDGASRTGGEKDTVHSSRDSNPSYYRESRPTEQPYTPTTGHAYPHEHQQYESPRKADMQEHQKYHNPYHHYHGRRGLWRADEDCEMELERRRRELVRQEMERARERERDEDEEREARRKRRHDEAHERRRDLSRFEASGYERRRRHREPRSTTPHPDDHETHGRRGRTNSADSDDRGSRPRRTGRSRDVDRDLDSAGEGEDQNLRRHTSHDSHTRQTYGHQDSRDARSGQTYRGRSWRDQPEKIHARDEVTDEPPRRTVDGQQEKEQGRDGQFPATSSMDQNRGTGGRWEERHAPAFKHVRFNLAKDSELLARGNDKRVAKVLS